MHLPWMNLKNDIKKSLEAVFKLLFKTRISGFFYLKIFLISRINTMGSSVNTGSITSASIIEYWYSDRIKSQWFNSTKELDQEIKDNYEGIWKDAICGDYNLWKEKSSRNWWKLIRISNKCKMHQLFSPSSEDCSH